MPRAEIPIAGGQSEHAIQRLNGQLCKNMYAAPQSPGSKTQMALIKRPGIKQFGVTPSTVTGACRANGVYFKDELHTVIGNRLVKVTASGSVEVLGGSNTLATSNGRVSMAATRSELMFVDGVNGYVWDGSAWTLLPGGGSNFASNAPTHVALLDFRFVVNDAGTDTVYCSALNDAATEANWNPADYAVAEALPDTVTALHADMRYLWLIGRDSIEIYANTSSTSSFPFEPVAGGTSMYGTDAPHSVASGENQLFMLARTMSGARLVLSFNGTSPARISDDGFESVLAELGDITDAIGMFCTHAGHPFYILTLPTANRTFVHDITTRMWFEWSCKDYGRFRMAGVVNAYNKTLGGDFFSGQILELDRDTYTDLGDAITCLRRSAKMAPGGGNRTRWDRLEIEFEVGDGVDTEGDEQIAMRYSDNDGHTWSHTRYKSVQLTGDWNHRVYWNRLGTSKFREFEIYYTGNTNFAVLGAWADVQTLRF